ncbi:MAG: hypothetical protein LBP80_05850 [Treponema sp.]|jgi:hypothetical protein|nr:hypothetical protein [Treponema sp.]
MVSEKNPSIYDDRGAIGSSEELDEYGVWVKSGPQDISEESYDSPGDESAGVSLDLSRDFAFSAQDDLPDFAGFTDTEDVFSRDSDSDLDEFNFENPENDVFGGSGMDDIAIPPDTESDETMDFDSFPETGADTQDSEDTPASTGEISFAEINSGGDEELNFEDFNDSFPEESAGEADFPESGDDFTISFDDGTGFSEIPAEESLGAGKTVEVSPSGAAPDAEKSEVSTRLLLRIVNELSSIKTELSSLKRELTTVKDEVPREEPGDQGQGGFFGEADDEKIALTGDEMNNILHTASFSEETGSDAVIEEPELQAGVEPIPIEIDMDEFGPEPVITPYEEEDLSEDIPELSEDLLAGLETELSTELPAEDFPVPALTDEIPDKISFDEISIEEIGETAAPNFDTDELSSDTLQDIELPFVEEVSPDGEISDLGLDADLSLDFPPEDGEEIAGAFDASIDDNFARLIPEGFEEKPADLPLHTGNTLEEDDLLDAAILPEDESLGAEFLNEDIPLEDIPLEDIPAAGTDDITGLDSGFELDSELGEDMLAGDGELPEINLDLGAEFDADVLAADEDITIDIPAETENGESAGEEPVEFDFTEEPVDAAIIEDTESLLNGISPEETDSIGEEIVLPDITLEDEEALELPVEDESLSVEFGEFTVEAPEEALDMEILSESGTEPSASPPSAAETRIPAGGTLANVPVKIREELKTVLTYIDQLLESLPEKKIEEFAKSEYFDTYKKLFEDLDLV